MKILALAFLLVANTAMAQPIDSQIQKIEAAYQKTVSLSAEFVQTTHVAVLDKTITRHGRFFYGKGGKLRIEYSGDPMTYYISDGKNFWIWEPKEKKLSTYSLEEAGLPDEALNFLGGLGNLSKTFQISAGKNGTLKLKPKKKSAYRFLEGNFSENGYLKNLNIHTLSGNLSHYRFFNIQTDMPLPSQFFHPPL